MSEKLVQEVKAKEGAEVGGHFGKEGEEMEGVEDEEEDEGDEEEEEEVEPKLIYDRIGSHFPVIIDKDAVSCVAVHPKVIAVGTHWGRIYILDHQGNQAQELPKKLHTTTVTQISFDEKGEFIGSCSDDKVLIHGLCSADYNVALASDRPVRAIAIDPYFCRRNSGRRFAVGDDKVVLHEKTFLSRYKTTVLQQGDGQIRNIRWRAQFIAWASDLNVRVYDVEEKAVITVIRRDHDPQLRPELYRCCLFWRDDRCLLIGWADSVKVCEIKSKRTTDASNDLPKKYVEITSMFSTNFCVSGLAAIESNLVILAVNKQRYDQKEATGSRPQLLVIEPNQHDFIELSSDILSPKGYSAYRCYDYHLEALFEDGTYFVVCPKDMIVAKPREEDDHVAWLLEHKRYPEALEAVKTSRELRRFTLLDVGRTYVDYLLEQNSQSCYEQAAKLSESIIGNNKKAWEELVICFSQRNQLQAIAPYLPTSGPTVLETSTYENVLKDFLRSQSRGFLELIRKWPANIYQIPVIIHATMDVLQFNAKDEYLLEALAELYTRDNRHDKALEIYLQIGNNEKVFGLIQKFDLYSTLKERLAYLMQLNPDEASRLLLDHQDQIPMELVVNKLKNKQNLLWVYLDRVVQRDPELCSNYHTLLVDLYAQFAPKRLLPFLRASNHYSLEKALAVCKERNHVSEMVFLLGRMGNTKEALKYITDSMDDIHYAIEFCKEHGDPDLWEDLISHSMTKPCFIRVLLQNIGTQIPDPISLIHRIPEGLSIEGLRPAVVKILQDYKLQISLEEHCKRILVADCYQLLEKLNKLQQKATSVGGDAVCQGCQRNVFGKDTRYATDVVLFNCRHVFHEECLPVSPEREFVCSVCIDRKQSKQLFS